MAEKPEPPKSKKFDAVEDAHFRIDDLARDHAELKKALDGALPTLLAVIRSEIERLVAEAIDKKLEAYKREDKAEDRKMIADAISKALDREETVEKHGTVETPDGVHKMHVIETRKRDK